MYVENGKIISYLVDDFNLNIFRFGSIGMASFRELYHVMLFYKTICQIPKDSGMLINGF